MAGQVLIGVSGWRYPPWRGHFYPPGLAQARELEHVARTFNSLELNGSFYSLQHPASYARWVRQTPISPAPSRPCAGRDGYCYFDNTDKRHAPDNARELMGLLGVTWSPGAGQPGAWPGHRDNP
ncbi:MAG TPA: DUF72 domain-containing protein [Ramlibacter sp.]|nr:DUF72 domain-containing protein [Ramlibacter sp.]